MEGIKDKVAIIGMGCTKFGELWDKSVPDLIIDAAYEAYADAGIEPKDIQGAWLGTVFSGLTAGSLSGPLKTQNIPVTRVENMCATGIEALRAATYAVASGAMDIALAVGVEKLKDAGWSGVPGMEVIGESTIGTAGVGAALSAPGGFAELAQGYFRRYNIDPAYGKKLIAQIVVKSHHNGSLHPKAHFQRELTLEQVMNAPIVAYPLGVFDCCGVSDGCAAAIVCRADMAKSFRADPIYIKSLTILSGGKQSSLLQDYDFSYVPENAKGAKVAYASAGIQDPRKEISLAEVHDCFSIHEMLIYEDLGFSPRGHAKDDIEAGTFTLQGELPINTDGGLKCFGHPLGASGLRMMYEVYKQLQGKAGPRQVKNPQRGLCHNIGGGEGMPSCAIGIVGNAKG